MHMGLGMPRRTVRDPGRDGDRQAREQTGLCVSQKCTWSRVQRRAGRQCFQLLASQELGLAGGQEAQGDSQ